jgi:hypothetical protein
MPLTQPALSEAKKHSGLGDVVWRSEASDAMRLSEFALLRLGNPCAVMFREDRLWRDALHPYTTSAELHGL